MASKRSITPPGAPGAPPSAGARTSPAAARRWYQREHLLFALVFLLALGLRAVHYYGQWRNVPLFLAPTMDERKHHEWAQQIATGQGLGPMPFFRAPLYYVALAGVYKLFGPNVALARFLGCVLGAATCYLIARLGRTLAGWRAGVLAGLMAAVYWPFIHFDQLLLTVGLETFLNVVLLLLLIAAVQRGTWWLFVLAGIAWGLSAITRPTVLTFAPVVALWVWFGAWLVRALPAADEGGENAVRGPRRDGSATSNSAKSAHKADHTNRAAPPPFVAPSRATRLRNLALLGAAAAAMILPVTLYNRIVGGEWVLVATNGGVNFYIGNNPRSDGLAAIVPGTRADWDGGFEDTHAIARRERGARLGRPLTEGEVSDYWYEQGWSWIRSDPAGAFALLWRKLALFWTPVEIPNNNSVWFFARQTPLAAFYWVGFPVVAVLGLAGLVLLPRRAWRVWSLPVLYFAIGMATVVAFFVVERYRMPMVPILMLAAAAGLVRLPDMWRRRRIPRLVAYVAVVLFMIAVEAACCPGAAFWPTGGQFWPQEEARGEHALGGYYLHLAEREPEYWPQALQHYQAAAKILPQWPEIQLLVGTTALHINDPAMHAAAGTALARAVELRPTYAEARRFYAEWLISQGRGPEAIEQFRKVVELQPWGNDYQEALRGLGMLLGQEGQYADAADWLVKAVQNNPHDRAAVLGLADAARFLRKNGHGPEALALLHRGAAAAPDALFLLSELVSVCQELGQPDRAAELAERGAQAARTKGDARAAEQFEGALRKLRAGPQPNPPGTQAGERQ